MSRLSDRVTRRASPDLDTDLSGLGLSFIYPGNVRFSCDTLPISSILAFSTTQIHLSSVTGSARNPFGRGKPLGARQTTAPAATRDLPTPRCARNRDLLYRRHLAVPSTSPQTVPGVRRYPQQSPLRGFDYRGDTAQEQQTGSGTHCKNTFALGAIARVALVLCSGPGRCVKTKKRC